MDVVILRDSPLPDPSIKRVEEELKKADCTPRQVLYDRVLVELDGEVLFFVKGEKIQPQVVLNWLVTRSFRGYQLLKSFEATGIKVVNCSEPWWVAGSDFLISLALHKADVPHPYSWHASCGYGVLSNLDRLQYPLLQMPSESPGNSRVVRLEHQKALKSRLRAFHSGHRNLDFQKARESELFSLVKVIVLHGKAVAAFSYGPPQGQRRGLWGLFRRRPRKIALLSLEEGFANLAERAAVSVGLDVCGVDMYRYSQGWEVAKVNTCPDIKGIETDFGMNVASKIVEGMCKGLLDVY